MGQQELARLGHNAAGRARWLAFIGEMREQQRDFPGALGFFDQAIKVMRSKDLVVPLADLLMRQGWCQAGAGLWAEARAGFAEALSIRKRIRDPLGEAEALEFLGLLSEAYGNYESAVYF